jgi:hypothetical protein
MSSRNAANREPLPIHHRDHRDHREEKQGLGTDWNGKGKKRNSRRGAETQRKREPQMDTDEL